MLRFIFSGFLMSCLIVPWAAHAQRIPVSILVWGDSLSAGYGLSSIEAAWPVLLQKRLKESGFQYRVINGSVSGETTSGGRSRLTAALEQHRPTIVILELGANDGLRGLRPALMADNLTKMIIASRAAGAEVLLIGMQLPPNYGERYLHLFEKAFADVAKAQKVAFVPFLLEGFGDQPDFFQSDGIHPVEKAQPIILDTVWKALKPLLKR